MQVFNLQYKQNREILHNYFFYKDTEDVYTFRDFRKVCEDIIEDILESENNRNNIIEDNILFSILVMELEKRGYKKLECSTLIYKDKDVYKQKSLG